MKTIEVYTGCMFAGKSSKLIELARHHKEIGLSVCAIKPGLDSRYNPFDIVSHDGNSISSAIGENKVFVLPTKSWTQDIELKSYDVVIVDETQFFSDEVIDIFISRAKSKIIFGGLDLDAMGKPFGSMPRILCLANHITKLIAKCSCCGNIATRTFRKNNSKTETIQVGGSELYEPRCIPCWNKGIAELE